jgi:hypothetical protein
MAERYNLDAARVAYDATPPADTAALFWHGVANKLTRGVHGVTARLGSAGEGWAPKLTRMKPCSVCGERFTWHGFADGGRSRVCNECTDIVGDAMRGRR